jgi:hypothetical protein
VEKAYPTDRCVKRAQKPKHSHRPIEKGRLRFFSSGFRLDYPSSTHISVIFLSPKVCSREEDILKQADEHVGYIIYDPRERRRKGGKCQLENKLSAILGASDKKGERDLIFMEHRVSFGELKSPKKCSVSQNFFSHRPDDEIFKIIIDNCVHKLLWKINRAAN